MDQDHTLVSTLNFSPLEMEKEREVEPQSLASTLTKVLSMLDLNLLQEFLTPENRYDQKFNMYLLSEKIQDLLFESGFTTTRSVSQKIKQRERQFLFSRKDLARMYFKGILDNRNSLNEDFLEKVDQMVREHFSKDGTCLNNLIEQLVDSIPLESAILDLEALEEQREEIRNNNFQIRSQKDLNRNVRKKEYEKNKVNELMNLSLEKRELEKIREELRLYEIRLNNQESEYLKKLNKKESKETKRK